jgi:hypothetical protein
VLSPLHGLHPPNQRCRISRNRWYIFFCRGLGLHLGLHFFRRRAGCHLGFRLYIFRAAHRRDLDVDAVVGAVVGDRSCRNIFFCRGLEVRLAGCTSFAGEPSGTSGFVFFIFSSACAAAALALAFAAAAFLAVAFARVIAVSSPMGSPAACFASSTSVA